ncbi:MAG: adenosine kinase, partial [Alphaproteobacteria bacterium]|nr:adenosine kinase [Alphaproteobacteria bacterium]
IARDCPIAVLTRSAAGCVIVQGSEVHAAPAYPVSKVVDVTGAGDLFAAGFLYGYTSGKPLAKCAQLGAVAAAEIISHMGARPEINLRSHAQALELL